MNHSKAVVDGELHHVSPSQIKRFLECPKAWYEEKVLGIERSPSNAMVLGTQIHKYLQEKLTTGVATFKYAAVCEEALKLVPTGGQAELSLETVPLTLAAVPIHGFIDYLYEEDGEAVVVDWKTTSDLRRAMTVEEAAQSPQTALYLGWLLANRPEQQVGVMKYIYIRVSGAPGVKTVSLSIPRADIIDAFIRLEAVVRRMKETAKKPANEVLCTCGGCKLKPKEPEAEKMKELPPSVVPLILLIDAVQLKGMNGATFLETIIAERIPALCEKEQVNDLRLVPFGKGKGLLAASLRSNPPTGVVICRSGDLSDVAIEALTPIATSIIRGIR